MKYKNIFDMNIEQEINKVKSNVQSVGIKGKDSNKKYEWYAMVVCMKMPEASTESLYAEFSNKYPNPTLEEFANVVRAVNLDVVKKRRYIQKIIKVAAVDFKSMLHGDEAAIKKIGEYLDNLIERDTREKRLYFKAKYLLTYLVVLDKELKNDNAQILLENYLEAYCTRVLRFIYKNVLSKAGMKRSTKEVIASTQKALEASKAGNELEETSDTATRIEQLNFQVTNYKNTLELVQSMFDDLKDSIEESGEEAKKTAVREFFISLNAQEYGNILDSFLTVEKRLNDLRVNQIRLPQEVMPLAIIFKQLIRFVRDYGIEPIEEVGRIFDAAYQDIALMNYQGDPYLSDEEKKHLQVTAPGWRYKNIMISLPTVREAEETKNNGRIQ